MGDNFEKVNSFLKSKFPFINEYEYDGILIKQLANADVPAKNKEEETGNVSAIAITSEKMDFFPALISNLYEYSKSEADKNFYILRIPLIIYKENMDYLSGNDYPIPSKKVIHTCISHRISDPSGTDSEGNPKKREHQLQLSKTTQDDPEFMDLRKLLEKDDFLVLLKIKEKAEYIALGIRAADAVEGDFKLSSLIKLSYFYDKLNTKTKLDSETVLTNDGIQKTLPFEDSKDTFTNNNYIQNILYGVPGCGKSHTIERRFYDLEIIKKDQAGKIIYNNKENQVKRIVFHPEYTNSDFIGQILPKLKTITDEKQQKKEIISYDFSEGPFTEILKKAYLDSKHNYALVIEEINRGNAAAIFGELFQLLDRFDENEKEEINGYEYGFGWSSYTINNDFINKQIRDAYDSELCISPFIQKENFNYNTGIRLPPNFSIIATMNTSDQNVFKLDNAFKRRWDLQLIKNEFDFVLGSKDEIEKSKNQYSATIDGIGYSWGAFISAVNKEIISKQVTITNDKQIGCWFVKCKFDVDTKENIITKYDFSNKVLEYLWDDVFTYNHEDEDSIFYKKNSLTELINDFYDGKTIFSDDFIASLNKEQEIVDKRMKSDDQIKDLRKQRSPNRSLESAGIQKGFIIKNKDGTHQCLVTDNNKVILDDFEEEISLNAATNKLAPGYNDAYSFWYYNGEKIKDLYNKLKKNE